MISRIAGWVGGSLLTGALALASSGATTPQNRAPVAAPAPPQCVCALSEFETALDNLNVELGDVDLASDEIAMTVEAAQDAREAQDAQQDEGPSVRVFSSSTTPGWLGIRMEEITSAKAKELNLPAERGALVTYVAEGSPAANAGLKPGDVITDFDGQRVESTLTLQRLVHEVPAGRKVSLSIWREGHAQSLTVEISSRRASRVRDNDVFYVGHPDLNIQIPPIPEIPPMPPIEIGPFSTFRMFGAPTLGIDAEDLSGQLGNYFGAPDGQGVLVREVMPGTAAEKAGLKAGDVIVRVDGKRVKDASELRAALRDKLAKATESAESGKAAAPAADLVILRSGKESTIHVELELPNRHVRPARRVAV